MLSAVSVYIFVMFIMFNPVQAIDSFLTVRYAFDTQEIHKVCSGVDHKCVFGTFLTMTLKEIIFFSLCCRLFVSHLNGG